MQNFVSDLMDWSSPLQPGSATSSDFPFRTLSPHARELPGAGRMDVNHSPAVPHLQIFHLESYFRILGASLAQGGWTWGILRQSHIFRFSIWSASPPDRNMLDFRGFPMIFTILKWRFLHEKIIFFIQDFFPDEVWSYSFDFWHL